MDSTTSGNQNPWETYSSSYRDCSQGICSIYCPRWCYIIFPPPPPFKLLDEESDHTDFSPLVIAVIGILASAFILVSYYMISKYYRRAGAGAGRGLDGNDHDRQMNSTDARLQAAGAGLDETLIKSITVCKYKKGDGFVDGTDCPVCLGEFQENESLRLLPKCSHAFHLPCIDTWLKSHASCPLCRANIAPTTILPTQAPPAALPVPVPVPVPVQENSNYVPTTTTTIHVSAALHLQHRTNDAVLEIQDLQERSINVGQHQVLLCVTGGDDDHTQKTTPVDQDIQSPDQRDPNPIQPIRRSVSLNYCRNQICIADILGMDEDDGEDDGGSQKILCSSALTSPNFAMKRSISTGRFTPRYGKGVV